jgi:hypothetical protein
MIPGFMAFRRRSVPAVLPVSFQPLVQGVSNFWSFCFLKLKNHAQPRQNMVAQIEELHELLCRN